jgi:hypothetical protein
MPTTVLTSPPDIVMIVTHGGTSLTLSDVPGVGGITLETSDGSKLTMSPTGIEIDNGKGANIKLSGPQVSINSGALEVT